MTFLPRTNRQGAPCSPPERVGRKARKARAGRAFKQSWAAALPLLACILTFATAPDFAQATLIKPQSDGTLAITNESSVANGGSGKSGVLVTNTPPFGNPVNTDESRLYVYSMFGPDGAGEQLQFDANGTSHCVPNAQGDSLISVVCDAAAVRQVLLDVGDGDDLVVTQGVIRVGDERASAPTKTPAVYAKLGAGNDRFTGGPSSETVEDGPGTDWVSGFGGAGLDVLIQPDVANPSVEDAGDYLDTNFENGVVDYSLRGAESVRVTSRSGQDDDGAPGEGDTVNAYGVRGTNFADHISGIDDEEFIGFSFDGEGGSDTLLGGAGADVISGGPGADVIKGDIGADELSGDAGNDTFDENDGDPETFVTCGTGTDAVLADPLATDPNIEPPSTYETGCESVTRRTPVPLEARIESRPPPMTNDSTPTVAFSSNERRAEFECALDGTPFQRCSSPLTSPVLADGPHTLLVRAIWGTRRSENAEVATTIDTVDPETTIPPGERLVHNVVDLGWVSNEQNTSFECRVGDGGWQRCTGSLDVSALDVGTYDLSVRAIDAATNVDASPAETTFTVTPSSAAIRGRRHPKTGCEQGLWHVEQVFGVYLGV